jgi:hypothetical protein
MIEMGRSIYGDRINEYLEFVNNGFDDRKYMQARDIRTEGILRAEAIKARRES